MDKYRDPTTYTTAHGDASAGVRTPTDLSPAALRRGDTAAVTSPPSVEIGLERAAASLRSSRFDEAVRRYRAVIELDPVVPAAWQGVARALSSAGRPAEALAALQRLLALDGADHRAVTLFDMGLAYKDLGDRRAAVDCFDGVLAVDPSSQGAWHNKGMALLELGQTQNAYEAFGRAVALAPDDVRARLWRGYAAGVLGREEEARAAFEQDSADVPDEFLEVMMGIGDRLRAVGRNSEAKEIYGRVLAIAPGWDLALIRRGACRADLGDATGAIDDFRAASAANAGGLLTALGNEAAVLGRLGRHREAGSVYRRVVEAEATSAQDRRSQAAAFLALHRPSEALASLAVAVRMEPGHPDDHFVEGCCRELLGEFDAAIAAYERLVAAVPEHIAGWRSLARCRLRSGTVDAAVRVCERAVELDGDNAATVALLGHALAVAGRDEEASTVLRRAIASDEFNAALHAELAVCLHRLGRQSEAIDVSDAALALDPSEFGPVVVRARALEALGRSTEAQSWAALAFALDNLDSNPDQAGPALMAAGTDPGNWFAARALADICHGQGEAEMARALYERALEIQPADAWAWTTLASIYSAAGDDERAGVAHERAISANPALGMPLRNATIFRLEHGDAGAALELADRALELEPDVANGHYLRGVALFRTDRWAEAATAFQRCTTLAPDDGVAWLDLSTTLLGLSRFREGIDARRRADQLGAVAGEFSVPIEAITVEESRIVAEAYARMERQDHTGALALFDRVLAAHPDQVDLWIDSAISAEVAVGPEAALERFHRARELDPELVSVWYNEGVTLMNMRRHGEAATAFRTAMSFHRQQKLPIDRDLMHAAQNLGACLLLNGDYEAALDALDEVPLLARWDGQPWTPELNAAHNVKMQLFALIQ
jgi:tetratricopeptide (TPR) repeat protein